MDTRLRPCPHIQILLKMVTFFLHFKKYVPCRKYVSTRKCYTNGNMAESFTEHATRIWCLLSFFRLSTRRWEAYVFKSLHSGDRFWKDNFYIAFGDHFWKDVFSMTVFTRYVWMIGQAGEKKSLFSNKNGYMWTRSKTNKLCRPQLGAFLRKSWLYYHI